MTAQAQQIRIYGSGKSVDHFRQDVLDGLRQPQKSIPCKYLYDE